MKTTEEGHSRQRAQLEQKPEAGMLEKQPIFSKDDLVLGLGPKWKNAVIEAEMGGAGRRRG